MSASRPIADVEADIRDWIQRSCRIFEQEFQDTDGKVWALKYFSPRFLETFLRHRLLAISATPGFTWGDGIYVVPLKYHYSAMMYGRVGVMGWIGSQDVQRVYDASQQLGIALYQEWITYRVFLYRLLTTTLHADSANRLLRNMFRRRFDIDLVIFPPDQHNRAYVAPLRDHWFLLSDWSNLGPQAPGQRPAFSRKVRECEWIVLVEEEFEESTWKTHYRDLLGPHLMPPGILRSPVNRPDLTPQLESSYQQNRGRAPTNPPIILSVRP